jgi:hypothetical protein
LDDQISLLKHKLQLIHQGVAFNGKRTKTARSQGRKFQVTLEQEATRLLVSARISSSFLRINLVNVHISCSSLSIEYSNTFPVQLN